MVPVHAGGCVAATRVRGETAAVRGRLGGGGRGEAAGEAAGGATLGCAETAAEPCLSTTKSSPERDVPEFSWHRTICGANALMCGGGTECCNSSRCVKRARS